MVAKLRILRCPIKATPENIENIIKAAICLHNYLRLNDGIHYIPSGFVDFRDKMANIRDLLYIFVLSTPD